jgi:hypothetical protein
VAGSYNITIDQGASIDRVWTWLQADQVTPVNLTGFSAHLQVRDRPGGTLLADFSTAAGQITLGGVAGTITLIVAAAVTAAYGFDSGTYDLHMTDSLGSVTTLLAGLFVVNATVTI